MTFWDDRKKSDGSEYDEDERQDLIAIDLMFNKSIIDEEEYNELYDELDDEHQWAVSKFHVEHD